VSGLLWITAAIVQLCAVVAYTIWNWSMAFCLLEGFVLASFGLTIFQIIAKRDQ
jgi:hypothetical protein